MTFIAGNIVPSYLYIGVTRVKPPLGFEPSIRGGWMTCQLSYPSPSHQIQYEAPPNTVEHLIIFYIKYLHFFLRKNEIAKYLCSENG